MNKTLVKSMCRYRLLTPLPRLWRETNPKGYLKRIGSDGKAVRMTARALRWWPAPAGVAA